MPSFQTVEFITSLLLGPPVDALPRFPCEGSTQCIVSRRVQRPLQASVRHRGRGILRKERRGSEFVPTISK